VTTTTSESKSEKFKAVKVEKGIRQIGPGRWEVQVYVGRHPETGQIRSESRSASRGIADARKQGRAATTLAGYRTNIESTIRPRMAAEVTSG
jgi:hypothetical protein